MPRRPRNAGYDERSLSKGQMRKLNALKKSLGDEIATRAFSEWLSSQPAAANGNDPGAGRISDALQPLIEQGKLRIPRGGYIVRRGRGRVIVERPE